MTGAGALLVEEVRRDSEGGRHACGRAPAGELSAVPSGERLSRGGCDAGEGDGAVRLEELVVREHLAVN